jgi:hypothetical protein
MGKLPNAGTHSPELVSDSAEELLLSIRTYLQNSTLLQPPSVQERSVGMTILHGITRFHGNAIGGSLKCVEFQGDEWQRI